MSGRSLDGTVGDWRLEVHASLPSTADLLLDRAAAGAPEGLAILALEQTAGRGRAGRAWVSPPGNLYLSVLLRPDGPARDAPQWSLLAAVSLAEAAAAILPDPACLRLKWPNDLLRNGAKCAGILAETTLTGDGRLAHLALGIGVNLAHAPALPDRPTATLDAAEPPEAFAHRLLGRLAWWSTRRQVVGFAAVHAAWLRLGPDMGAELALREGPRGRFAGLAADGSLLLDVDGTRRAIATGEILSQGKV